MRKSVLCCSSPAAICYWFMASVIMWGLLALVGTYWRPLHGTAAQTILLAMAFGCFANWMKNRTAHCFITGPVFFLAALLFLLGNVSVISIDPQAVWLFVGIGTASAFALEWRLWRNRSKANR